jgi:hypothetical protein
MVNKGWAKTGYAALVSQSALLFPTLLAAVREESFDSTQRIRYVFARKYLNIE